MSTKGSQMRAARKRGARWEHELLDRLRYIYGEQVNRTPHTMSCDFANTDGVKIEAKAWRDPRFMTWVYRMRRTHKSLRWVIMWCGDRRKGLDSPVACADLEYMLYLLWCERELANTNASLLEAHPIVSGDVPEVLQGTTV